MERSLKDCVNESRLVNEKHVSEETTLVTIMESVNVRIDEKFRIITIQMMMFLLSQRMMKYFLRLTMICKMKEIQGRNKAQNLQ